MAFTVVFRPRARADIAAAVTYHARQSPSTASRWRTGLLRVIATLEADPNRYPQADEAGDLGVDLREYLYGRGRNVYRFLFSIDGETVSVLRVRHAAQDHLTQDDV
ncbi:MAG: plasmid stabilization system [Gemmataceae bacterium]|nr:plasmid stabilization system [Gemmataceae bacterium]